MKGNDHSHMSLLNKDMLYEVHDSKCTTLVPNKDPGLGQRKDSIRTLEIYKLLWLGGLQVIEETCLWSHQPLQTLQKKRYHLLVCACPLMLTLLSGGRLMFCSCSHNP